MISFRVPGVPVQQGSMNAFVVNGRAVVTHKSPKALKDYRARVAVAAEIAGARCTRGPVSVRVSFYMQRPKSHFGTGRNEGVLKDSAPRYCTTTPDVDKLARSILDALTGVCFNDDSQVVELRAVRLYADDRNQPGTSVAVTELERKEQHVA